MNLHYFDRNNFFYLLLLSFILISTSAISMNYDFRNPIENINPISNTKAFSDIPLLKEGVGYPVLSAQSVLAVDVVSGVYLYEKDPQKTLLPASTTKIVTALVAIDTYEPDQILKVGKVSVDGQKMGLIWGEEMKFIDLLKGLLIYSSNDAAEVLANNHPGGRDLFIALMNKKSSDLGLTNTHFTNPSGLDNSAHYSTAKDLITISRIAMQNSIFSEIVGTREETVKSVNGKLTHKLVNINKLLGEVDGVLGVKTGWTENARENLVTYVDRNGKKVMIVVLGSSDRFGETKELIDWIYSNYSWEKVTYSP